MVSCNHTSPSIPTRSAGRLTAVSRGYFGEGDIARTDPAYCDAPSSNPLSGLHARRWLYDGLGNWAQVDTLLAADLTSETRSHSTFNEIYQQTEGGATTTCTHDKNGNLTFDGTHRYEWDARNRLRHVKTTTGSLVATYYYDAANRRVRKELADGTDMDYFYSGWQVVEERRASDGAIYRDFVDGNFIDEHLQMRSYIDAQGIARGTVQKTFYYLQNTLYSVYGLADADGDIVEAYEYDPYGKHVLLTDGNSNGQVDFDATDTRTIMGASPVGNPYTFTGRRFDPESGLHHYRNRYYSADQGRFVSRDPIGVDSIAQTSASFYLYVNAVPIYATDPLGLIKVDVGNGVIIDTDKCKASASPKTIDQESPTADQSNCCSEAIKEARSESIVKAMRKSLSDKKCPDPNVICAVIKFDGVPKSVARSTRNIDNHIDNIYIGIDTVLYAKDRNAVKEDIKDSYRHEMTHAVQFCLRSAPFGSCDAALKSELEAYICEKNPQNVDLKKTIEGALCSAYLGKYCKEKQIDDPALIKSLADYVRKAQQDSKFCEGVAK